jgi:hypothetical protein
MVGFYERPRPYAPERKRPTRRDPLPARVSQHGQKSGRRRIRRRDGRVYSIVWGVVRSACATPTRATAETNIDRRGSWLTATMSYSVPQIDCESRISLCKAACCKMHLPLSQQDLQERCVRWYLSRPYVISQSNDVYCTHLARGSCRCNIYPNRPLPCRAYDCRDHKWIGLDFEKNIINPDWTICSHSQ